MTNLAASHVTQMTLRMLCILYNYHQKFAADIFQLKNGVKILFLEFQVFNLVSLQSHFGFDDTDVTAL